MHCFSKSSLSIYMIQQLDREGNRVQNEIVRINKKTSTYSSAKHVVTWGVNGHAPSGNLELGAFIIHNLVDSGTVFSQT